jgi:hypothetical protein
MATNLVTQVLSFLTPDLIARIAAALGLDRGKADSAISAAVPGLLAALGGVAAQPGGAQRLAETVRQQNAGLGDIAGMIASGRQSALADEGAQTLSSLLGPREESALAAAVGKFANVNPGTSTALIGMLAPIVMGSLKQAGGSTSGNTIANLLAGQKDSISAALPSGFRGMLDDAGLLDSIKGPARTAASTAYATAGAGQRAATQAASTSRDWLYWLVPLAAAAAVLFYVMRPADRAAEEIAAAGQSAAEDAAASVEDTGQSVATGVQDAATDAAAGVQTAAADAAAGAQSIVVDGLDIGEEVTDGIGSLNAALSGITDAASAETVLPKLQEITGQFDAVSGQFDKMSAEQKTVLAGLINQALPTLNELIDKVLAIPGVAAVAGPQLESLKTKLAAMAA